MSEQHVRPWPEQPVGVAEEASADRPAERWWIAAGVGAGLSLWWLGSWVSTGLQLGAWF